MRSGIRLLQKRPACMRKPCCARWRAPSLSSPLSLGCASPVLCIYNINPDTHLQCRSMAEQDWCKGVLALPDYRELK